MNKDPAFLADKQRRVHDPQIAPLNVLVEAWRAEGRQVPWADPDSADMRRPGLRIPQRAALDVLMPVTVALERAASRRPR